MEALQSTRYDLLQGTLEAVDLVGREIQVISEGKRFKMDVPVVCQIIMYDERVRLRMLQPSDVVEIMFTWENGQAVAQSIEVLTLVQRARHPRPQPVETELAV
jgi:hypothetical protein